MNTLMNIWIISIFLLISKHGLTQQDQYRNSKIYWTSDKTYDDQGSLVSKHKIKKLIIVDRTTRKTQCYLKIYKTYEDAKCIDKKYSTVTRGGCRYLMTIEHDYDKRLPRFPIFRVKVFLGCFGFKNLLYELPKKEETISDSNEINYWNSK